ncbi:MAG: hypothetical protein J7L04_06905, partial [Bacteroidales bacterium]|nr:hypothetical protein [Bacteroidales bacterium]
MKKNYQITILISLSLFLFSQKSQAQYSTIKVKKKYDSYEDSLKQVKYDYIFPIWGQGAYSKGFDIPYPVGIMANYIWMKQGLVIDNMQLGLKGDNQDIPLTPTDFIEFGENTNTSYVGSIRPDVWIFPFLNVYGLFGYGKTHTEVNLVAPVALKSVVDQGVRSLGIGIMGASGLGPVWISVDANWTWNKPELVEEPTRVSVLGLRFGHTFVFKNRPYRNIAVWAGAFRLSMSPETYGSISLAEALPPETWERADEIVEDYYYWYDNEASPGQKEVADKVLTPIVEKIGEADGDAIISYGMDKQTKQLWNGIIGMQFQLDKSWQLRTELGVIGDR